MSHRIPAATLVLATGATLSGCAAIEGIFKAGAWTGAIMVVLFLALVGGVTMLMRK